MKDEKIGDTQTDTQTDDTHLSRTIVPSRIYFVREKNFDSQLSIDKIFLIKVGGLVVCLLACEKAEYS